MEMERVQAIQRALELKKDIIQDAPKGKIEINYSGENINIQITQHEQLKSK